MAVLTCPGCRGAKAGPAFVDGIRDGQRFGDFRVIVCHVCRGTGLVSEEYADRIAYGTTVRKARVERDETGDEMAQRLGWDRIDWNHCEHGRPRDDSEWARFVEATR